MYTMVLSSLYKKDGQLGYAGSCFRTSYLAQRIANAAGITGRIAPTQTQAAWDTTGSKQRSME